MLKTLVAGVVTGIILILLYVAYYTGYYRPVSLREMQDVPAFHLIYKDHIGAYHKIVPKIQEVEAWAQENQIDCRRSFGLYLDSPRDVEEARLRSKGGCLVDRLPDSLPEDIKSETWPGGHFVVAQFEGSAGIGPLKVYPAAFDYIEEKGLGFRGWSVLEVYEVRSERSMLTTYYFPVSSAQETTQDSKR